MRALKRCQGDVSADDKTAAFIQALADDAVKVLATRCHREGRQGVDPVTGAEPHCRHAEDVINNNRMRGEIDYGAGGAQAVFGQTIRCAAKPSRQLQGDADESKLPLIEKALRH
jgi:urea transport system permease protein